MNLELTKVLGHSLLDNLSQPTGHAGNVHTRRLGWGLWRIAAL